MTRRRKNRSDAPAAEPVGQPVETAPAQPNSETVPAQPAPETAARSKGAVWRGVLHGVLIAFACVLALCFVLLCLSYLSLRPLLTVELGDPMPEATAFLRGDGEAAYEETPDRAYPAGAHLLRIRVNGHVRTVMLRVRDTIPPAAEGVETTVSTKEAPTPDKLLKNITDESIVKVTYEVAPKYGTVGDYTAIVRLEDRSGNDTRVAVKVHVRIAKDAVYCEAGEPAPDPEAFLIDTYAVTGCSEITEAMMRTPGVYPIEIEAEGTEAQSRLIVRDTQPPKAQTVTRIVEPGTELAPEDFVTGTEDATELTMRFLKEPDPDSRVTQTVEIEIEDLGGNTLVLPAELLYTNVQPIRVEARTEELEAEECLEEEFYEEAAFDAPFIPNVPGTHMVNMTIDGEENLAIIEVVDTTPPTVKVEKTKWYLDTPKEAAYFAEAFDVTKTTLRFREEPDWTLETQDVTIVATDTSGNETEEVFTLKLRPDTEPPSLYGVKNRYCYIDEAVAYMEDVSASDNCDPSVTITVDTSRVDPTQRGEYLVRYKATDRAGNSVEKTVVFTFIPSKVTEEEAEAVAQKILAKVLKEGMTLGEQVEALYEYVFRNLRYTGRSNKTDWRSEAVRGLTTGKGDCFTSYACLRLLLEHTDAQLMSVERYNSRTHHYWMIVNVGTGWYHVDACNTGKGKKRCFMWTNAQKNKVSRSFWRYNEAAYPPIATEPYNGGK